MTIGCKPVEIWDFYLKRFIIEIFFFSKLFFFLIYKFRAAKISGDVCPQSKLSTSLHHSSDSRKGKNLGNAGSVSRPWRFKLPGSRDGLAPGAAWHRGGLAPGLGLSITALKTSLPPNETRIVALPPLNQVSDLERCRHEVRTRRGGRISERL